MLRKRDLVSKIMDYSGILKFVSHYRKKTPSDELTILAYHRVLDYSRTAHFDFDSALISANKEDFEKQIEWLKKHFSVITFKDLQSNKIGINPLIITFDDGYKDNYENVYPILRKYNVPATIFLATGYIGTNKVFWWDEIAYLINKTPKKKFIVASQQGAAEYILSTEKDRKHAAESILKFVMDVSDENRNKIMNRLREDLEVDLKESLLPNMILNWDEIREMSENGIEFGAHSVTHPVLSQVNPDVMRCEIEESKKTIEREINKEALVFAYPVGCNNSIDGRTKHLVEKAGYLYAVAYVGGKNTITDLDRLYLKRIRVEEDDNISIFKTKVLLPELIRH